MIRSDESRRIGLVCLLLVLVTFALYWPVRGFEFVEYDDPEYILRNPEVSRGLSAWGLVWSFVDAHAANWHPLTWLSHMLDCQLFGLRAGAHHLVNVAFHSANAALLFLFLRSLTGAFWRAATVAALFAWHPLRVESVAWVSERKDVLSGFFFLLTLLAYERFAKAAFLPAANAGQFNVESDAWKSWHYRQALIFFVLGLLAKPMLVTVPLVLLLVDFWLLRRLQIPVSNQETLLGLPWKLWREKIPFVALSLAVGVITIFAQRYGGSLTSMQKLGPGARLENFLASYPAYLEKLFWPRDLAVLYLRPETFPAAAVWLAVLVLASLSLLAGATWRRRPWLLVGWLWFVGMLLPVTGLVQVGLQFIADRYTYLPGIGFFVMLVWGIADIAETFVPKSARTILLATLTALSLAGCLAVSRHQLGYWQDTGTLMRRALEIDPNNYIAHTDIAIFYSQHGDTRAALFHRQRAKELDPANKNPPAPQSTR